MNKKLLRHIFKGLTNPKNKSYIKVAKDVHYILPRLACAIRVDATDNPFIPGKAFDAAPEGVDRMFNKGADSKAVTHRRTYCGWMPRCENPTNKRW